MPAGVTLLASRGEPGGHRRRRPRVTARSSDNPERARVKTGNARRSCEGRDVIGLHASLIALVVGAGEIEFFDWPIELGGAPAKHGEWLVSQDPKRARRQARAPRPLRHPVRPKRRERAHGPPGPQSSCRSFNPKVQPTNPARPALFRAPPWPTARPCRHPRSAPPLCGDRQPVHSSVALIPSHASGWLRQEMENDWQKTVSGPVPHESNFLPDRPGRDRPLFYESQSESS